MLKFKLLKDSIFEAKLNLPQEYIQSVNKEAKETFGAGTITSNDIRQIQSLLGQIFSIQRGHEKELTELGKNIILKFYGPILDDVELDIKIVNPNDEEKRKMTDKMLQNAKEEESKHQESPEIEIEMKGIETDIDKRKLINNIMQGEAQNVHDMMYDMKSEVTSITNNDKLLDLYMEFLKINRKFDWEDSANLEQMIKIAPEGANAVEVNWDEENEDSKPKIKARVLDLPMLIHETVKGIYELIAAGAIDPDPVRAQKVLDAADSLEDEKEDIKYGPFIARDIRNYVNSVAEEVQGSNNVQNLREFVFGELIQLSPTKFVEVVTNMLLKKNEAKTIVRNIIEKIVKENAEYIQSKYQINNFNDNDIEDDVIDVEDEKEEIPSPVEKKLNFSSMGKNELNYQLNKAIDDQNWELAKDIQKALERKGFVIESLSKKKIKGIHKSINEWDATDYIDESNDSLDDNIDQLEDLLQYHDWYYHMSDDHRVYVKGNLELKEITNLMKKIPKDIAKDIWEKYVPNKKQFPFPFIIYHKENILNNVNKQQIKKYNIGDKVLIDLIGDLRDRAIGTIIDMINSAYIVQIEKVFKSKYKNMIGQEIEVKSYNILGKK